MSRDDDFAAFMQSGAPAAVTRLQRGQVVSGPVVQLDADSVFVALGTRSEGRIPALQLAGRARPLQVGDTIEATVVDPDAPGGPLLALTLGAERGAGLEALALAFESGTPMSGKFTKAMKSGLEVEIGGVRAFCPASQLDLQHVADLASKVGETARFLVLEIKEEGRSVIVSRRRVLEQERTATAQVLRAGLRVGDDREGTVTSVQKFGAFVDLGGLDGLVHISELSPSRVERVEDVVKVGERVKVRVLGLEQTDKGERIRLSMKALIQTAPADVPQLDEILEAQVLRLLPNGLIVQTKKGEGLVPLRELNLSPGADHRRAFQPGHTLEVTLLNESGGRLRFSAQRVEEVRTRQDYAQYQANLQTSGTGQFGGGFQAALSRLTLGPLPSRPIAVTPPKPAVAAPAPVPVPVRVAAQPASPPAPAPAPAPQAVTPNAPVDAPAPEPSDPHSRRRIVRPR
jgi:small subunit ribosomal protein S1